MLKRILERINWPILIMAHLFWYAETSYFGWNFTAKSDAEMICDGIVIIIGSMAFIRQTLSKD